MGTVENKQSPFTVKSFGGLFCLRYDVMEKQVQI